MKTMLSKLTSVLLCLAMLLTMCSFAMAEAGTYTGVGDSEIGGKGAIEVSVTVDENGVVTDIQVTKNGDTAGIADAAVEAMPGRIMAAQSANVDGVSGATMTSEAIKMAVLDAVTAAGLDTVKWSTYAATEAAKADDATYNTDIVIVGAGGAGMTAALTAAEKGADGWKSVIVSTTAVYQPSEQSTSGKPKLARINNGFELAYPKVKELYRFERISNDRGETAYTLTYAKMGGVEVERQESYRYLVTQGEDSAMWVTEVTLENFNIHNMPRRGVGDVRRMRDVYSSMALYENYDAVGWIGAQNVPGKKSGKQSYPVYAAPSTEASRAAKGKASFSTGDEYRLYCTEGDWSLIEYRVSLRTSRFGWVKIGQPTQSQRLHIPMLTAYDTYLTDDPHVSEYHQAELPAGTKLTMWYLLGVNDDWAYAYVEATVDGKPMCGFVPRRDVVIDEVELPDEAAKYVGSWYLYSGSEIGYLYLRLDADGRFYCSDTDGAQPYGGTWCVVQNPMAGEDNFWISAESILVLNYSDSMTMRFGVDYIVSTTEEDGEGLTLPLVNLAYGEGGCTYVPYGAVDRYGNWVATADGSVRQMTLPIQ